MSKQKKKRNHFVPQSYLRSFAADPAGKKIWTFGKENVDFELRPIKKVAVKFYLYAPLSPEGRDYSFEDKLASLEQWFGEPLWKVLTTAYVDLADETIRKMLALLTAVMWVRNPRFLEMMNEVHRQLREMYLSHPTLPDEVEIGGKTFEIDKSDWPSFRDASEEDKKRVWLKEVGSAAHYAKKLMKMRWSILCSDAPVFITTDNPVIAIHPSLRFRGIENPDTTLMFPLSPTRVLIMDNRHSEPANQYYPLKASPAVTNLLLWRESSNVMFSSRPAEEVCNEICADAEAGGFRWKPGGWYPEQASTVEDVIGP